MMALGRRLAVLSVGLFIQFDRNRIAAPRSSGVCPYPWSR